MVATRSYPYGVPPSQPSGTNVHSLAHLTRPPGRPVRSLAHLTRPPGTHLYSRANLTRRPASPVRSLAHLTQSLGKLVRWLSGPTRPSDGQVHPGKRGDPAKRLPLTHHRLIVLEGAARIVEIDRRLFGNVQAAQLGVFGKNDLAEAESIFCAAAFDESIAVDELAPSGQREPFVYLVHGDDKAALTCSLTCPHVLAVAAVPARTRHAATGLTPIGIMVLQTTATGKSFRHSHLTAHFRPPCLPPTGLALRSVPQCLLRAG